MAKNSHNESEAVVYGLGLIGAAIYFIGHAAGFGAGILGFLKALVWPVFLVYGVFKYIGM